MKRRIGLEVHLELNTKTKLFCSCENTFGAPPNTHVCPICMGFPGSMPFLNEQAVRLAVIAGLALGCECSPVSYFHRKQYDYPDLPKGYQITQGTIPFAVGGGLTLSSGKQIPLQRIHLEEDAGKLIHQEDCSLVDDNRAGIPLIELVTQPVLESAQEAGEFLKLLSYLMRWMGVSDCNMNEGSMRCDVNLSLYEEDRSFPKCEIKNLNSIRMVKQAILAEEERQLALLEAGEELRETTCRFEEPSKQTVPMRQKETKEEYGFFPEPDLPPLCLTEELVAQLKDQLPLSLQEGLLALKATGLQEEEGWVLAEYPTLAKEFLALMEELPSGKKEQGARLVYRWVTGELFSAYPKKRDRQTLRLSSPGKLLERLLDCCLEERISKKEAVSCFMKLVEGDGDGCLRLLEQATQSQPSFDLLTVCKEAMEQLPKAVADVRQGKEKALAALIGRVMSQTKGRANPKQAETLLRTLLEKES